MTAPRYENEKPQVPRRRTSRSSARTTRQIDVDESTWLEVIKKMDEVYNDLLQYEVALEEKNAALEQSHQFIDSVLSAMSDVLVVCDRRGRVEVTNAALQRLIGHTAAEIAGKDVESLFADQQSKAKIKDVIVRMAQGAEQDFEVHLNGRDGVPVPIAMNSTARTNASGKVVGVVLTGRPVGELRRAYEDLRQAHRELQQTQSQLVQAEKMASLGRLVAGVAHELNNPISFVLGNVHALQRYSIRLSRYINEAHSGAALETLAQLRQELRVDAILGDIDSLMAGTLEGAERTRRIVDGLKRFASPDRDMDALFDLREVIDRAAGWVIKGARTKIHIENTVPAGFKIKGSVGQIEQVVLNLVQNAADSVASRDGGLMRISARIEDGFAIAEFRDNGSGISEEHLHQIFDPFFTTKPVGQGMGLGLSVTYGIVERHGGTLRAANHPQGGAVFELRLPMDQADFGANR